MNELSKEQDQKIADIINNLQEIRTSDCDNILEKSISLEKELRNINDLISNIVNTYTNE